ncbi:MAG: hypothetical protein QXL52_04670 [Nitrososphaerales archaeon]
MKVKINKKDLEDEKQEDKIVEPEQREEVEEEMKTFTASDKVEQTTVTFLMPKRELEKLKRTAEMFEKPYGQLIREAIEKHVRELNDISYLDSALESEAVDEIIECLEGVSYLTPKALRRIYTRLKDKRTFAGENKWNEFCRKIGINSEIKEEVEDGSLDVVVYLKE